MLVSVPYEEGLLVFRDWRYTDGFIMVMRGESEQEHKYSFPLNNHNYKNNN